MITNIDMKMNEILLKAEQMKVYNMKMMKYIGAELLSVERQPNRETEMTNREKAEEIINNDEFPEELSQYLDCLVKLSWDIPIEVVDFDKDSWNSGFAKFLLSNFTHTDNTVGFMIYPNHKIKRS